MTSIDSCDNLARIHAEALVSMLASLPFLAGADLSNARITALSLLSDVMRSLVESQAIDASRTASHFDLIGHFYSPISFASGYALKYRDGVTPQNQSYLFETYPDGVVLDNYQGDRVKAVENMRENAFKTALENVPTDRTNRYPA